MSRSSEHHFPCPCGAELADECPRCAQSNPLGSMRLDSIAEHGLARVRAAIATANRPSTQPTDPNPTRARALARARHERTTR